MSDGKAEATLSSSLPAPNFELLTSCMPIPLDLKRCQSHSVIALDQQKPEMSNVATTANQIVFPIGLHNVGGAATHDIHKNIPNALNKLHTSSNSAVQKRKGVATTVSSSHVTQDPRKVKADNSTIINNHHMTTSSAKQGTSDSHTTTFASGSLTMSGVGETYRVPLDGSKRGENSRKRTWNEDASDDEFDTLCNMVDLSFDTDVVTSDQVTEAMTPDIDKWSDSQNACHSASTTVGSTGQLWTCPMCNEQFEGRLVCMYIVRLVFSIQILHKNNNFNFSSYSYFKVLRMYRTQGNFDAKKIDEFTLAQI